ncbi:NSRP1 [Cordylochernes scorpioides]|uniref:NSRP1 n=1 Tax=Cordylochernes scorpioides TaxID=51811 RepID=A0ABY6LM84_9ARAC|nr:NSRP1 [Cordylochernes scorpioides]
MAEPKKYGLILKNKNKATVQIPRKSIFDDSDDENGNNRKKVLENNFKKEGIKKRTNKQTQLDIQKAKEEDPSVFEYDTVYDDMKRESHHSKILATKERSKDRKKPKYIHALLHKAEQRRLERERCKTRKIHKEREQEGEEFADKQIYVTSSYKKQLEEQQALEAREERERQVEEILDVRKQKDLSGFYRHLYKQRMGEEHVPDGSK